MEQAGYMQTLRHMLEENEAAMPGLPRGTAFSLPAAVRWKDSFADAFFFFEAPPSSGRPFAWTILEPHTAKPLVFSWCEANDFTPPGAYPMDMAIPLQTARFIAPAQKSEAREELLEIYGRLRPFIFDDDIQGPRLELMERFTRLFTTIAYVGHYPFYRALAPDFLRWVRLDLAGGPQPGTVPDTAEDIGPTGAAVRELSRLFQKKIMQDNHKQKLFDEMHAELQAYKNGLIDTLTRPMEGDIIKLIDDIEKSMDFYRGKHFSHDNYRRLLALFEGVGTDLGDLLYRHGLEPFSQQGNSVVVGRQKVLSTIPTDKPRRDKKVAERHSKGWEKNGKVIRPERVTVYVYEPPPDNS